MYHIHPDDQPSVLLAIQDAIQTKSTFELEHRVLRADGTLGWVFSRAIPVLDAHGAVAEWFGAAKDVTERKQADEALREADRRKDEFMAVLAHELRSPLAPIANAVQLLGSVDTEDSIPRKALKIIERQTALLARLVDDLLEMARITSGRLHLRREQVALDAVVERACETLHPVIEKHRHVLQVDLLDGPIWVDGDPVRLEQICVNLLNNAAKYTNDGGMIELSVRREDDHVVLRVRDNGIGIEPALLPRLFQPFTQAQHSRDRSNGGLGLGLSLVRHLVVMHGGTVEAESTLGRGSEFTVRLPILNAPANEINTHS